MEYVLRVRSHGDDGFYWVILNEQTGDEVSRSRDRWCNPTEARRAGVIAVRRLVYRDAGYGR